jgi:hypothetical protein
MKKIFIILLFLITVSPVRSQLISAAIKKAIMAIDLDVQRLQNKTIWLQNAQKALENTMSRLKLDDITGWVQKQRDLYAEYYQELKTVKDIITYYRRIKDITQKQVQLVATYKRAFNLFKQDSHFTPGEIEYMAKVYGGIFDESVKNLDQIFLVINSFSLQMADAKRLEIIDKAADKIDQNYSDLQQFNTQNQMLSLQRSKSMQEIDEVKALYGIQ